MATVMLHVRLALRYVKAVVTSGMPKRGTDEPDGRHCVPAHTSLFGAADGFRAPK